MQGGNRRSLIPFLMSTVILLSLLSLAPPIFAQQVTAPSSGTVWHRGETQTITWTGFTGNFVRIELLRGSSKVAILSSMARNTGSFNWVILYNTKTASDYRIRVTGLSRPNPSDRSDSFTITGPTLTVRSPNGGETWRIGSPRTIKWRTSAAGGTVRIELFNGSSRVTTITPAAPNTGSFAWNIPRSLKKSSKYRVHIVSNGMEHPEDFSDAYFTIKYPSINVTSPNDSTITWKRRGTYDINWVNTGNPGSVVRIDLYRGSTRRWAITNSAPNTGLFSWTVPPDISGSSDYRVKVTSANFPQYSDLSDQPFTISAELLPACRVTIASPAGDPTSSDTAVVSSSEISFDNSVPGLLTVHCQFRVQAGMVAGIASKVRAAITTVDDSTLQWIDPATGNPSPWAGATAGQPTGANTAMGLPVYNPTTGFFEIDAVYTNLPTNNSGFGLKTIWAQIVEGTDVLSQDSQPIEVFYTREEFNNPGVGRDTGPNWYYYWKTGNVIAVSPGPTAPVVLPGWEYEFDPFSYGFYVHGDDHIHVSDLAATNDTSSPFNLINKYTGAAITVGANGVGPDMCAICIVHEMLHKRFGDHLTGLIAAAEADGNDYDDFYDDADDDGIPNGMEIQPVFTDPVDGTTINFNFVSSVSDPDTYNMAGTYNAAYATYGDEEVRCRMIERIHNCVVNYADDWAFPGTNTAPPYTP